MIYLLIHATLNAVRKSLLPLLSIPSLSLAYRCVQICARVYRVSRFDLAAERVALYTNGECDSTNKGADINQLNVTFKMEQFNLSILKFRIKLKRENPNGGKILPEKVKNDGEIFSTCAHWQQKSENSVNACENVIVR